jgi:hypothetical protein
MSEPGYRRSSGVGYCVASVTRRRTAKSHRAFADVGLQAIRVLAAATGRTSTPGVEPSWGWLSPQVTASSLEKEG